MSNKDIAINWVQQNDSQLILSDSFFKPFSDTQAVRLRKELISKGYYIWPLGESLKGACIVRKDHPKLTINAKDGFVVGVYKNNDAISLLGMAHFADTIGCM